MDVPNEDEPTARTKLHHLGSWEDFQQLVTVFEDPSRKLWDEVWFRGQADARWPLHSTLERRSTKIRAVAAYLNLIAEIKPAIETFTGSEFHMPSRKDVEESCREYDRFEWVLREAITYMAHLRHGGFPSPLLDWTRSPYVAAYFAFSGARHDGEVAIHAYQERPVNMKIGSSDASQIISFGPLIKTHKRHFRQQSRYTVCTRFHQGQWFFVPHHGVFEIRDHLRQDLLWKITIPTSERRKALEYF
ncbi:MAG: FRG domain-containing protein [Xanthobacteraceae bacterium]